MEKYVEKWHFLGTSQKIMSFWGLPNRNFGPEFLRNRFDPNSSSATKKIYSEAQIPVLGTLTHRHYWFDICEQTMFNIVHCDIVRISVN